MKKIIALLLVCVLISLTAVSLGDAAKFVTVQEWMDAKGECGDCMLLLRISAIINPVLAVAEDETGTVNLFSGSGEDSMIINFMGGDDAPRTGDLLVIGNPRYNEFEGAVEMADWTLLRFMRGSAGDGSPMADDFFFWDGIRWGMSRQEVVDLSGEPQSESDYNGFMDLFYAKDLDGFENEIQMFFLDDSLMIVQCCVSGLDNDGLGRLEELYRTRYGEPIQTGRDEFAALCEYMKTPTDMLPEDENCYAKWESSGTRILEFKPGSQTVFFAFVLPNAQ